MTTLTEATVQAAVQTFIQALAAFEDADVVINDYTIVDGPFDKFPVAVIKTADNFRATSVAATRNDFFDIPVTLYEEYKAKTTDAKSWKASLDNLRDHRQLIIDAALTGANNTLSIAGLMVREVRNEGLIEFGFNPKLSESQLQNAVPVMLFQTIILSVESF